MTRADASPLEAERVCCAGHLDGKERPAVGYAVTADDLKDIFPVCASCAQSLVAMGWLLQPRLLDVAL
jgi:hypothetical protein